MTDRTPWWKAFLPKKKTGGKDSTSTHTFDPDFDPFAPRPEKPKDLNKTSGDQSQPDSNKSSSLLSDETFDDSHLESVFNEQTCRRKMAVSRSGRYKEKRRVRSSLPIQEKETEKGATEKEERR
uniref:proline-rich protein 15-like n=1 Tax=Semicossyphus pulcher TaxID=241346 RepID=UPI0037E9729C